MQVRRPGKPNAALHFVFNSSRLQPQPKLARGCCLPVELFLSPRCTGCHGLFLIASWQGGGLKEDSVPSNFRFEWITSMSQCLVASLSLTEIPRQPAYTAVHFFYLVRPGHDPTSLARLIIAELRSFPMLKSELICLRSIGTRQAPS